MILITGGPVAGNLDDVKVITNKFKGGRMASLADEITAKGENVIYLTQKGVVLPESSKVEVRYHTGFADYMQQVLALAPNMDAVVLGAAVCNLIPANTIAGKFPSHNYKPGEIINIPFMIAPRVIDEVKKVAPRTKLFGFKLLSNANHEELIDAAYESVLASKAVCIFANDTSNLNLKYVVTKERSIIPIRADDIASFILDATKDVYYKTVRYQVDDASSLFTDALQVVAQIKALAAKYDVYKTVGNHSFGCIAVRMYEDDLSFITTARGKETGDEFAFVSNVNHERQIVDVNVGSIFSKSASLNAPLLSWIFSHSTARMIIHTHEENTRNLPTLPYAFPGTVRDSTRTISGSEFYIKHHGTFKLI